MLTNRTQKIYLAVWDTIAWITVVFPVVTGGIWMRQPGLKLELTQINAQATVLILTALALRKFASVPIESASSIRALMYCWRFWQKHLSSSPIRTLVIGALGVGTIFAIASVRRHLAFGSGAADLGIFTNAIWNLTHGYGYVSSVKEGVNLFSDHQSPVFWLLAPLFYIFPFPETLLIFQAFAITAGAIALFAIGRQYLSKSPEFLAALPILYWAYLPMRNANAFDFHPEVLILPAFLTAIAGLQSASIRFRFLGVAFLLIALAGKESSGPLAVGVGLAWLLGAGPEETRRFTRRFGGGLIVAGTALFIFDTKVVPGLAGAQAYAYEGHYSDFGTGVTSLLLAPFLKTQLFFERLLGISRLKFIWATIAPLGLLPLLAWKPLIATALCYLMLFLGVGDHRLNPIYHYATEPAVGLFWALVIALAATTHRFRTKTILIWLACFGFAFFGRSEIFRIRNYSSDAHHKWLRSEFLPSISSKASVSASGALVPQLATRHWVHHLPRIRTMPSGKVDCVIFDPKVNQWPLPTEAIAPFFEEIKKEGFFEVYNCDSTTVFQNSKTTIQCLSSRPQCLALSN